MFNSLPRLQRIIRGSGGGGGADTDPNATTTAFGFCKLSDINTSPSDNTTVPTTDVVYVVAANAANNQPSSNGFASPGGATYTLTSADHKKIILCNQGMTITIPSGLSTDFECVIKKQTASDVILSTALTIKQTFGYSGTKVVNDLTIKMFDSGTVVYNGGTA